MRVRTWLLAAALACLLAPTVGAQEPELGPPVEVEDVEIPGLVVPLEEPDETEVGVRVGCETHEVPDTETRLHLEPAGPPDWLNVVVSPSTHAWRTSPGDCPSPDPSFEGTSQVSVAADQDAPAFEEVQVTLEAMVVKQAPAEGDERSYGPYQGNLSLTPGYFHQHRARMDVKIQQGEPGETLRYEGTLENRANAETEYTLTTVEGHEDHRVRYDPEKLVLVPEEKVSFAIEVTSLEEKPASSTVSVETRIQGQATHELGGEGEPSRVSVLATFSSENQDPRDASGLAPSLVVASVAALATAGRRAR